MYTIIIPSPIRVGILLSGLGVHYYYPIPHKGVGFCCLVWVYTIIIPSPIRGWDLVVVRTSSCRSDPWLRLWPSFQDILMKLTGHIGHGPNSSYPDVCPDMSCCHGIMTENVLKNGQMNLRIYCLFVYCVETVGAGMV